MIQQMPVMTFKRVIRSPELQDPEFSRASEIQKYLWINHTTTEEKATLWFKLFSPYFRTKLWNSLSFSEDYIIGLVNTPKYYR